MKKELTIGLLAAALTVGMASMATAQEEQDTNVEVNISGTTQLDVRPSSLSYGGDEVSLEPGDGLTESDLGFEHVEISNIGSERIGSISAEADMPETNPFGTGTADNPHNTGNFVTISTETASGDGYDLGSALYTLDNPHYLNRVEYAENPAPTYIQRQDEDEDIVGRLRVGGAEYFYVWVSDSGSNADGDDSGQDWELRIGNTPHTSTDLGTTDFSNDGGDYTTLDSDEAEDSTVDGASYFTGIELLAFAPGNYDAENDGENGAVLEGDGTNAATEVIEEADSDVEESDIRTYNLYLDFDTDKDVDENYVARATANTDLAVPNGGEDDTHGETITNAQQPLLSSNQPENQLQPGQSFPVNFGIELPLGVDQDSITEGTVTFLADEGTDEPEG